jgi:hypothetical protein
MKSKNYSVHKVHDLSTASKDHLMACCNQQLGALETDATVEKKKMGFVH